MSLHEKRAWFNLAVFALALSAFLIALIFWQFERALGTLGFCGLIGFNPYYYRVAYLCRRSKKSPSEMFMDERDISIRQKAKFIALYVFFAVFVSTWAALWATNRLHDIISIDHVIALPLAALFVLIFAESVAMLVQYAGGK